MTGYRRVCAGVWLALAVSLSATTVNAAEVMEVIPEPMSVDPFSEYQYELTRSPLNHRKLAASLLRLGEIDLAIPHLESAGDRFELGRAYFLKSKWQEAFRILSVLESGEAHLLSALAAEHFNTRQALVHYLRARRKLPIVADYLSLRITRALVELERPRSALFFLKRAIAKHESMREDQAVREELARVYLLTEYPMLARREYLELLPSDRARYSYLMTLIEDDMRWDTEESFRTILRNHPRTVWAVQSFDQLDRTDALESEDYLYGGIAYGAMKDYGRATSLLEEYLENSPEDDRARFELAFVYYMQREYELSYDLFGGVDGDRYGEALFYRGRCMERDGRADDALREYRKVPSAYPQYPEARYYAGRLSEKLGRFEEAIGDYRNCRRRYPGSAYADDASFRTGFLFYSMGKLTEARKEFREFARFFGDSSLLDGALYWMAKSTTDETARNEPLERLLRQFPRSYYTKLACENFELDPPSLDPGLDGLPDELASDRRITRGSLFLRLGLLDEAEKEFSTLPSDYNYLLALLYHRNAVPGDGVIYAYRAGLRPLKILYPRSHIVTLQNVSKDPILMLALVREESRFEASVLSRAGAIGLAQIIPPTGSEIAQQIGFENFAPDSLLNPKTNLTFGAYYLEKMLQRFNETEYALAAYNAGPHRVDEWLEGASDLPLDEFVENIPFSETRKYVRRVMASYWNYSRVYSVPTPERE